MSRRAYGLRAWMWQRASAVYLTLYLLSAGIYLLLQGPSGYMEWRAWMANTAVNFATGLFFGALLIHAWVGARDVIMDYANALVLRLVLLGAVGLVLAGSGLWLLKILYFLH